MTKKAAPVTASVPRKPHVPPRAPAPYRPQPTPRVLQRKSALDARAQNAPARPPLGARPPAPNVPQHAAPNVPRNAPPPPRTLPQKPATHARAAIDARAANGTRAAVQPKAAAPRPASNGGAVQRVASKVVQATKLYPNLHPGAVESVEPGSVFKLSNFADQYRLRKTQSHGVYVPNQLYNFVRTSDGEMLLHNRYRHPSIAEGRQVLYAGEVHFNNGKLEWWSNGSGHYQPDSEDAQQAALPMDSFYSYQQIIKGEHKRKKS